MKCVIFDKTNNINMYEGDQLELEINIQLEFDTMSVRTGPTKTTYDIAPGDEFVIQLDRT